MGIHHVNNVHNRALFVFVMICWGCHLHTKDVIDPDTKDGWPATCVAGEQPKRSGCLATIRRPDYEEITFSHNAYPASVKTTHVADTFTTTSTLAGTTTSIGVVVRNTSGDLARWKLSEFSPVDGTPLREQEYIPGANNTYRISMREYPTGAPPELREFDIPRIWPSSFQAPEPTDPKIHNGSRISDLACSDGDFKTLLEDARYAIGDGFICLRDMGRSDLGARLLTEFYKTGATRLSETSLKCDKMDPDTSAFTDVDWRNITVNTELLKQTPQIRQRQLFHEWLHLLLGFHDADVMPLGFPVGLPVASATELDQIYACASLCFDKGGTTASPAPKATKCACAKCLGTSPRDKRCAGLAHCVSRFIVTTDSEWHIAGEANIHASATSEAEVALDDEGSVHGSADVKWKFDATRVGDCELQSASAASKLELAGRTTDDGRFILDLKYAAAEITTLIHCEKDGVVKDGKETRSVTPESVQVNRNSPVGKATLPQKLIIAEGEVPGETTIRVTPKQQR